MKQTIKKVGRKLVFPFIYHLGLESIPSSFTQNSRVILCYHGVEEKSQIQFNGRHIAKETFELHLQYYRKHFDIVPLTRIFELYREGIIPEKKTLAITFDDGYLNNYEVALPLLKKYNVPATFFISSVCINDPNFIIWADVLDLIRELGAVDEINYKDYRFERSGRYKYYDRHHKIYLSRLIKTLDAAERDHLVSSLISKHNVYKLADNSNIHYWKLMTRSHLEQLATEKLIEIGSHSHKHYNLANIPIKTAKDKLLKSKQLLEEVIKKPVRSLAFPDGNYNKKVKSICKEIGYNNLLALDYLLEEDKNDDSILPRINISGTTNYYSNIINLHNLFPKRGF